MSKTDTDGTAGDAPRSEYSRPHPKVHFMIRAANRFIDTRMVNMYGWNNL